MPSAEGESASTCLNSYHLNIRAVDMLSVHFGRGLSWSVAYGSSVRDVC